MSLFCAIEQTTDSTHTHTHTHTHARIASEEDKCTSFTDTVSHVDGHTSLVYFKYSLCSTIDYMILSSVDNGNGCSGFVAARVGEHFLVEVIVQIEATFSFVVLIGKVIGTRIISADVPRHCKGIKASRGGENTHEKAYRSEPNHRIH